MITPSGVRFENQGPNWRAVLPQGEYLPEAVVVEQTEQGLQAHLEAPLDQSFVFPCQQKPDGTVVIQLAPDDRAEVLFHPDSCYYGVRSGGHSEGYRANGNWVYDWGSRGQVYHAERSPGGELRGSLIKGDHTLPMAARMDGHRLVIEPDRTPLRQRIAEHGFFSGLKLAVQCFTSGSLNTFFFKEHWELFPTLASRAEQLRTELEAGQESVKRLARPPERYTGVKVSEQSVAIGGVVLKRAVRTDPQSAS